MTGQSMGGATMRYGNGGGGTRTHDLLRNIKSRAAQITRTQRIDDAVPALSRAKMPKRDPETVTESVIGRGAA
jgi:hypothetical protein